MACRKSGRLGLDPVFRLLDPTILDCIAGYIMEDAVGDRSLKRLHKRGMDFIDGSNSSYSFIINSTK